MSQILIRPEQIRGDRFHLDGSEAHHVIRVLRKKAGDELNFFDGRGRKFQGVLTDVYLEEGAVGGKILAASSLLMQPVSIRLLQGFPKGSKFDYVIEKATELGATEILPFLSEKSLIRLSASQISSKAARWSRLATSAAKQCDRFDIPTVVPTKNLRDLSSELTKGFTLAFLLGDDTHPLRGLMQRFKEKPSINLNIVIGPESGFTKRETDWLVAQGAHPTSLGSLTLRTETAGLAALTLVNYELGLL